MDGAAADRGNRRTWPWALATTGAVLVGLFLRLDHLASRGLWLDEALGVRIASLPTFPDMLRAVAQEIHPPLFYILLRPWMAAFGDTDFSVRFFIALWGCLGIYGVYVLCRFGLNWSLRTSNLAALFAAILPLPAYYSQEVRPYALIFALSCFSLSFLFRAHRDQRLSLAILYGAFQALVLYLHHTAILFCFTVNVLYFGSLFLYRELNGRRLRNFFLANGVSFVLYLPWLSLFFQQLKSPTIFSGFRYWVPQPSPKDLIQGLANIIGVWEWRLPLPLPGFVSILAAVPILCLLFCGFLTLARKHQSGAFVLAFAVPAYPLLIYALSHWLLPVWLLRILVPAAIGVPVIAARGAEHAFFSGKTARSAAVLGLSVGLALFTSLNLLRTYSKENWKGAAQYVLRKFQPEDSVQIYREFYAIALERYIPPGIRVNRIRLRREAGDEDLSNKLARSVLESAEKSRKIFLVLAGSDVPPWRLLSALKKMMTLLEQKSFYGVDILVLKKNSGERNPAEKVPNKDIKVKE
jgi:mannosyltransferase